MTEDASGIVVDPEPLAIDPEIARILEHFDRSFRGEVRSPSWADVKEAALREFFATQPEALGSRLLSADCRSSMCRVRIAHDDADALSRFTAAMGMRAPFTSAGARFADPDDDHSVIYLAHEGTPLPWPDAGTRAPKEAG